MTNPRRPRVGAIGLSDTQVASIASLCGELRREDSLEDYLVQYSWTETDLLVSSDLEGDEVDCGVNVMTTGPVSFVWSDTYVVRRSRRKYYMVTDAENTERELAVPVATPELYRSLAAELIRQLGKADEPPNVITTSRKDWTALIETTSGKPVALHLGLPTRSTDAHGSPSRPTALLLPDVCNLSAWFRAFLVEIHNSDPARVPHPPPRLVHPSDWYTPEEQDLAHQISKIESDIERLWRQTRPASDRTGRRRGESRQGGPPNPLGRRQRLGCRSHRGIRRPWVQSPRHG